MQSFLDLIRDFGIQARKELIHLLLNWAEENNFVCPPVCLIPRVLLHMRNCKASGTLIVPLWHSTPFWPMICADGVNFSDFIINWMDIPSSKEAFSPGRCNIIFGNEVLSFRMLARFEGSILTVVNLFCPLAIF